MHPPLSVAIIGAGPAGLSAALWCHNLGMSPVVFEREAATGGMQNFNFLENDWVLGLQGMTGVDIAQSFNQHVVDRHIQLELNSQIASIARQDTQFVLNTGSGHSFTVQAIIIATGTRYVGAEIFAETPNFSCMPSSFFIEGPYAFCDLDEYTNQHIGIIGGGDNAFENAMILLNHGCEVSVICRSQPRAQKKFADPVLSHKNFTLYREDSISQFSQSGGSNVVTLQSGATLTIDRLHILAGYQANSEPLVHLFSSGLGQYLECDQSDFLQVDSRQRTNVQGVYAAGDIHNTIFPNVVSAMASGALAAKTISRDFSLA